MYGAIYNGGLQIWASGQPDKEAINILEAQDDPLVCLQHKEEFNLVVVSTC